MLYDSLLLLWDCGIVDPNKDTVNLKPSDKELYFRIADIAKAHHRIKRFLDDHSFRYRKIQPVNSSHKRTIGLYAQAFSESVDEVLKTYRDNLVEIESKILNNDRLTLTYVYGSVEIYRPLFNTINRIITLIKERMLQGCQILGVVHQHLLTGNLLVRDSMLKIFGHINSVFINQLTMWILYGELKDEYNEFFITMSEKDIHQDSKDTLLSTPSTSDKSFASVVMDTMIENGYTINTELLPYYIPLSLAQEILFIGKTIILFGFDPRETIQQSNIRSMVLPPLEKFASTNRFTIWNDKEAEFHQKLQELKEPNNFEINILRINIGEIKACVTKHLWVVTVEQGRLIDELKLIKDFYLLGRGELFLELLRLGGHILDEPTTRTSTRDINKIFQMAARAVFLSNSEDIVKFSFELPYIKPNVSNVSVDCMPDGWSSILLKYNFKWPLHLVFTPHVLAQYNDMFRLLLRIKKTQHNVHALWMTYKQKRGSNIFQLHNILMFVLDNLQHYLQADVLDTNFSKFMEKIQTVCDFEELKEAHNTFLRDILSQSFLCSAQISNEDSDESDILELTNPVFTNIMDILKLCDAFCSIDYDDTNQAYHLHTYSQRFEKLMSELLQLLACRRTHLCGTYLARLLMRLDYNRWFSSTVHLTQSVTHMLY